MRRGREKTELKEIVEDQQESLNKWKGKGHRFEGRGRGIKAARESRVSWQESERGWGTRHKMKRMQVAGPAKADKGEPAWKQPKRASGAETRNLANPFLGIQLLLSSEV